jgi:hypothetical protein
MVTVLIQFPLPASVYTAAWKQMIRERYGADPLITYFDTPVVVDNATGEISGDA